VPLAADTPAAARAPASAGGSSAPDSARDGIPVALVTCRRLADLTPDDRLLLGPLRERGIAASAAVWDDPAVDWSRFAGVVVRSPWDYHVRPAAFAAWIDRLAGGEVPVWNPPAVLRWNLHKSYLEQLAAEGVPVVPTRRLPRRGAATLGAVFDETGWERVVVKPAISAGARRTMLVARAEAPGRERALRTLLYRGDVLVQPYVSAVAERGEWSLVFVDGDYSHAALKRPREGDFRVQERFGGTFRAAEPPPGLVEQARRAAEAGRRLAGAGEPGLLYARVDGVHEDGVFLLLELEVLEPSLFFEVDPGSAGRFADALLARVARPAAL
jgi:glutathione synthase/RimK-type ligase-like ATP-grasp enzyme